MNGGLQMAKVYVFLSPGFEEVEAVGVVDILRRANVEVDMVSIGDTLEVTSTRNVTIRADIMFNQIQAEVDMLVLPGGIPGAPNLSLHEGLASLILTYNNMDKYLAAICAAPTVYGKMGLLKGKNATCYPGHGADLHGANIVLEEVVGDGKFITSRGMGTTIPFALKLVEVLVSAEEAKRIKDAILYGN